MKFIKKKTIKPEYWILIELSNTNENLGINLLDWYGQGPREFKISYDDFYEIVKKMLKEGIIKEGTVTSSHDHFLTTRGRIELDNIKKKLGYAGYYHLISKFPYIELKERVGTIESFVFSLVSLLITYWIYAIIPSSVLSTNAIIYLIEFAVLFGIFLFLGASVIFFFIKIFFHWLLNFKPTNFLRFKEGIWNNLDKIIYSIPIIVIILLLIFVYFMRMASLEQIIFGLVIAGIIQIIVNYNKFIFWVKNRFPEKDKKTVKNHIRVLFCV